MRRGHGWRGAGIVLTAVLAFGGVAGAQEPRPATSPAPAAKLPTVSPATGSSMGTPGREEALEKLRAAREWRRSPAAELQRRRSRNAHSDLARSAAIDLLREKYGAIADAPAWKPFELPDGERVTGYPDPNVARIDRGGGGPQALLVSTVPLRSAVGNGLQQPVDHALQEEGDTLEPANPYVPTSIGKTLGQGAELPGIGLELRSATGDPGTPATIIKDKAFWPNVATDTDFMVAPVPGGLETFHVLRSVESPEELALDFTVPDGAVWRWGPEPVGGLELVKDGEVIARVSDPKAVDAQGETVGVELEMDGNELRLVVPHRGDDVAYPLLVDPNVADVFHWRDTPAQGFEGWGWGDQAGGLVDPYSGDAYLGRGLYMYEREQEHYLAFQKSEWVYSAPGNGFIFRADFAQMRHDPVDSCVYEGAWNPRDRVWDSGRWAYPGQDPWATVPNLTGESPAWICGATTADHKYHCFGDRGCTWNGDPGNSVVWGIWMCCAAGNRYGYTAYLGAAAIYMFDWDTPTWASLEEPPPGWTRSDASMTLLAEDPGLGLKRIRVTANTRSDWNGLYPADPAAGCLGTTYAHCPGRVVQPRVGNLPNGVSRIRAEAWDATDRAATPIEREFRVDKAASTIELDGAGTDPVRFGEELGIHVVDGTATAPLSGVDQVVVNVDGQPKATYDVTCERKTATVAPFRAYDQCPQRFDTTYRLPPEAYSEGTHTIEVVATDEAGNVARKQRTVYVVGPDTVDRSKLGLENFFGYESFPTGADTAAHVNVANRNVVWHSIPVSNPGRGLSTVVNLTYNSLDHGGYIGSLIRDGGTPLAGTTIDDLGGIAYGEAGIGFSLGISSLTRLNEPLTGVGVGDAPIASPATIRLTDVDGTRHTFQRDASRPDWYREPPGVQLALRRDPAGPANRRWIATRPDGVAFFFDSLGYQTFVRDRNGNEIRFEYEKYSKVTGKPSPECAVESPPLELLCTPRVVRVVDAAGVAAEPVVPAPGAARHPAVERRSVTIQYYDNPVLPTGSGTSPLSPALIGPVGGAPGRIKRVIDHGGRATDFAYDAEGYLASLAQGEVVPGPNRPGSTADRRVLELRYGGSGQNRQLIGIIDPRRSTTGLTYAPPADPGATGVLSAGMPATSLTTRRGGLTTFAPSSGRLKVTAPGPRDTFHTVDGQGRPTRFDDAVGASDVFGWDGDNNLSRIERGATSTAGGAVTTIAHDRHGNPVTVTDPRQKVTSYAYMYGTETGIQTHGGIDDGRQYVANLQRIDRPGDNDVGLTFDWTTARATPRGTPATSTTTSTAWPRRSLRRAWRAARRPPTPRSTPPPTPTTAATR